MRIFYTIALIGCLAVAGVNGYFLWSDNAPSRAAFLFLCNVGLAAHLILAMRWAALASGMKETWQGSDGKPL